MFDMFSLPQGHPRCRCLCFQSIFTWFMGQTVLVCQSFNAGLGGPPQRACPEKSKLNTI